jgi:regulatory protein
MKLRRLPRSRRDAENLSDEPDRPSAPTISPRLAALRLLGRREYTSAELADRLAARGYAPDIIERTLAELAADRVLDDRRAAAAHVRTASRVKGRGRLRILRELQARGVEDDVARGAVSVLGPDEEGEAIAAFLRRRLAGRRPTPEERRRLMQQLLRRGFRADAIAAALQSMVP